MKLETFWEVLIFGAAQTGLLIWTLAVIVTNQKVQSALIKDHESRLRTVETVTILRTDQTIAAHHEIIRQLESRVETLERK